jgi:hypothetical protein
MRRANRNILILKLVFVGVFALAAGAIWWHQLKVVRPRAECLQTPGAQWFPKSRTCQVPPAYACERGGGWWEPQSQTCAKVLNIPEFTGRASPAPKPQG